jgi:hypothetical protein
VSLVRDATCFSLVRVSRVEEAESVNTSGREFSEVVFLLIRRGIATMRRYSAYDFHRVLTIEKLCKNSRVVKILKNSEFHG